MVMDNKIGPALRPVYESLEDFSNEIKVAKVQKVFFQIGVTQQEIEVQGKVALPDGTESIEKMTGLKLSATITLSAVAYAPLVIGDIGIITPMHYVFSQSIGSKDCIEEADFEAFNAGIKKARDDALEQVQKKTNVLLFPGTITPVDGAR